VTDVSHPCKTACALHNITIYINTERFLCDIMIYWTTERNVFMTEAVRQLTIRHWEQSYLFLLIPFQKKKSSNKKINITHWNGCLNRRRKANIFHVLLLVSASGRTVNANFCFLFKSGRKLLCLIYMLLLTRRSPKEITRHQALESTIFNQTLYCPTNAYKL